MDTNYKGGCLCGAVRYEVSAEPMMAGICYCLSCQKLSGSGHQFSVAVPESAFRTTGETRGYECKADSGSVVTNSFCTVCGSPLFGQSSGMPGMRTVRVASLDDPSRFAPQMSVYTKRVQQWDHLNPALPKFQEMPPMPPR